MIDIIIPCYNAHNTLDLTLQSIAIQSIKDKVNVLLVDDSSNKKYDSFINFYSKFFKISLLRLGSNVGAGLAREEGINNTKSQFITFVDSDDMFYNEDSLELLYNKISEGYDLVNSIEFDQKRDKYLRLNGNVHGKLYKRKFIKDNDIHFNETRYHEDNYFNNFVKLSGAKEAIVSKCTYFYTYNNNSVTNIDKKEFERLEIYLKNMNDLLNIAEKRKYNKNIIGGFKIEKYKYLKDRYNNFNLEEKEIFKNWLTKYDKDLLIFLDLDKKEFDKKLEKYIEKYKNS